MRIPLTRDDLSSGAFSNLAKFIARNYPFDGPLKLSEAQELLARCFGYDDLHDAQKSAVAALKTTAPTLNEIRQQFYRTCVNYRFIPAFLIPDFLESLPLSRFAFAHCQPQAPRGVFSFTDNQVNAIRGSAFRRWDRDAFVTVSANRRTPWPLSLRSLFSDVIASEGLDIAADSRLRDFLELTFTDPNGRKQQVKEILYRDLFVPSLKETAWKILTSSRRDHADSAAQSRESLLAESGHTPDTIAQALRTEDAFEGLYERLWPEAVDRYGSKTVLSLFTRQRNASGFYEWSDHLFTPNVLPERAENVKRASYPSVLGTIQFSTLRRDDYTGSNTLRGHEWECRLEAQDGRLLAAVAGSVFVANPRSANSPSLHDLIHQADNMSEKDLILVHMMLQESEELDITPEECVEMIFSDSDIATVLCWERHEHAPKGAGWLCLEQALRCLNKRFRRLGTLVIDGRPGQFRDWSLQSEPSQILLGKAQACADIAAYIDLRSPMRFLRFKDDEPTIVYPDFDEDTHPAGSIVVHYSGSRGSGLFGG